MRRYAYPSTRHRQQGMALFISLILLLLMTMIGVTAMQTTTLQERMAGGTRDVNLAFQAAEAALREGEALLQAATLPTFDGTNGLYEFVPQEGDDQTVIPIYLTSDFDWASKGRRYEGSLDEVGDLPRYVIEELPPVPLPGSSLAADEALQDTGIYRITARATGGTTDTVVMLQSTFRR